jgi:signal transduction histidine kinase
MLRRYGSLAPWILGALLIITAFYAATARLWKATEEARASSLEKDVVSAAMGDIAEGNLLRFGSTLSKLQREGQIRFAEIRHLGRDSGVLFRTEGDNSSNDFRLASFDCKSSHLFFNAPGDGIGLVTVLPTKIAGGQCDVLLLAADMPPDLRRFKDRLLSILTIFVAVILGFFSFITIVWQRRVLQLEIQNNLMLSERNAEIGRVAAQVAHDIRSPLAALEVAAGDISQLPEKKRLLIRSAVGRIRDIANSLLDKNRALAPGTDADQLSSSVQLLSSLIASLVTEKRLQFRSRSHIEIDAQIDAASYGIFAQVQPIEFKRLLSNLINNAVEALGTAAGSVQVSLSARLGHALISVQDNGKGIPPEIVERLGRRGETHGKSGGSGLGIYHARVSAESWGGNLEISSAVGIGTTITVSLPQASTPQWFVSELALVAGQTVVILDDDVSIHQVWQERLDALPKRENNLEIVHVTTPEEIRNWVKANERATREALYLLDYELLGYTDSGLSLAEELAIGDRSILVTNRHEESEIQEGCRRLKTRLIPKGLLGLVPIRIAQRLAHRAGLTKVKPRDWDVILIDDDPLVRETWKVAADLAQKKLRVFPSADKFYLEAGSLNRDTPVYIDAALGHNSRGEIESRCIHDMGFTDIYLATGHKAEEFSTYAHLRGVVGKSPPWTS